ncbi:MAG: oxidoreductase [Rheinheimera sp.]|nr:oxidoreductase [Rheinheimera sp.]|tara:strand:+ start:5940 stop:6356 length:417 start_codon:yes stop_codon:yes gene_type:complete
MSGLRNGVMLALGDFFFSISTVQYQQLQRSKSWTWAKKNRLGRKPAKQFHGPDSDTITLNIAHFPENKAGLLMFSRLAALGDQGKPHRLVGSNALGGSDLGLWCIESLEETDTEFTEDGIPLVIKGTLKISEWGEDEF